MKKIFIPILAAAVWLVSCNKTETQNTASDSDQTALQKDSNSLQTDSIKVADSLVLSKTLTVDFKQKVLLFSGLDKQVLDSLYKDEIKPQEDYSKANIEAALNENMTKYFNENKENVKDYMPDFKQTWDRFSEMKVFSNENDFLTIKFTGYGFSGGAHGYAYENYKIADLKNQKKIQLEDIVEVSKVDWNDVLLKQTDSDKFMIFEPGKLSYNQNFYFDSQGITFVYGQYEIAPYAAGIIPIHIPYSKIMKALKPDFKNRMDIK